MSNDVLSTTCMPAYAGMRNGKGSPFALLLAVLSIPAGLVYLGLAYSMAAGMVLVGVWLVLTRSKRPTAGQPGLSIIGFRKVHSVAAGILVAVLLHLLAASIFGPVDLARALSSMLPLLLLIVGGAVLANRLQGVPPRLLHRTLLQVFMVYCLMALVGSTGWGPPTLFETWRRPVFPFSEPSAFALVFTPIAMYVCVSTRGRERLGWVFLGLLCSTMVQSLTLVCGLALVALTVLRARPLLIAAPLVLGLTQLDLSYYADRVDFSGEGNNLSNLVYVQGWQMIMEAWERSRGFGIGMQQLGVQGTEVDAAQVIRALRDGEDMNLLDGSFVFVKLGSDFGLFGLALALLFVGIAARSFFALRHIAGRHARSQIAPALVLAHCSVVAFFIELFVRSAGYFTGTALLLSASVWLVLVSASQDRAAAIRPG